MMMLEGWDHRQVQDFDTLAMLWRNFEQDGPEQCRSVGDSLRKRLGLPIVDMDADESRFFKHHYKSVFVNKGPMARE
jgi:hypothetical protein